jgi:hypothetical protein
MYETIQIFLYFKRSAALFTGRQLSHPLPSCVNHVKRLYGDVSVKFKVPYVHLLSFDIQIHISAYIYIYIFVVRVISW